VIMAASVLVAASRILWEDPGMLKIDRQAFLALALGMNLGACFTSSAPAQTGPEITNPDDKGGGGPTAEGTAPTTESGMAPTREGGMAPTREGGTVAPTQECMKWNPKGECTQVAPTQECVAWSPTNECTKWQPRRE